MPTAWRLLEDEVEDYLQELRDGDRAEITIKEYRWTLRTIFQALRDAKLQINPRKVGRPEINYLRNEFLAGRSERYKANMVSMLIGFAKWAGNQEMTKIRVGFGNIQTKRVRWLENDQAMTLKLNARGVERMIVHLELDLGTRRVEILRLKVSDFSTGRINAINLLGKGRYGGKPRTINWHPETPKVLEEYLELRDTEIGKAKRKNPGVEVPQNLLIYERNGKLHAYQKSAIEKILNKLGERVGFHFSNHDLRRTCGRMMYRAGVPIEIIARKFGHTDTRTTMKYLGLDFEDLSAAESLYAKYQASLICPKTGTFEVSQESGGQGGIREPATDWLEVQCSQIRNKPVFRGYER
jgi:integrase/recombinase XerD